MGSHRTFPEVSIEHGDKRVMAMEIKCVMCGAVGYFAHQTGARRKPPIAAQQNFQSKGWHVGRNARGDYCPLHSVPSARKEKTDMVLSVVKSDLPAGSMPIKAEPPRQMTREDRQIIHAKLSDVYDKDRYISPWTDEKVAKDLGVPRKWVSEIRDLMFGPENSNPLFDEFLTRVSDLNMAMARLDENEKKVEDAFNTVRKQREKLLVEATELRLMQRRIEKEIGR